MRVSVCVKDSTVDTISVFILSISFGKKVFATRKLKMYYTCV